MLNFRPFPPCALWKMPGNLSGRTDGHAVKQLRLVGWTNGPMYRSKEGISGFGRTDGQTDGRTDGQPENIMPPAPKGGGIKSFPDWTILFKIVIQVVLEYVATLCNLTLKRLDIVFLSKCNLIFWCYNCDISVWNWFYTMNIHSVSWILVAWCFSYSAEYAPLHFQLYMG